MIYRAYRLPYHWVTQLDAPKEVPIEPVDVSTFRMPGAAAPGPAEITTVDSVKPYQKATVLCVANLSDIDT